MPLKTKSVMTKAGDRHRITISTMDSSVKAAPLDPKVATAIKGEAVAEETAKQKEIVRRKIVKLSNNKRQKLLKRIRNFLMTAKRKRRDIR